MTTDTRPKAVEHNCETGEITERFLTDEEIAQREAVAAEIEASEAARKAERETREAAKASAKAKLIAGEPLTAEEADALVL